MELIATCAAVPFTTTGRAGLREPAPDPLQPLLQRLLAAEAAQAVEFVLGPRYRPDPPAVSLALPRCPPNSPTTATSFTFEQGWEADCSSQEEEEETGRGRKRRRLCSFSSTAPAARRVPHKKQVDERTARMILSGSRRNAGSDLLDGAATSRLQFYSTVQRAAGEPGTAVAQESWACLGRNLRQIADKFGGKRGSAEKAASERILSNGVWSAVLTYFFWKLVRGFQ